jgi:hypothetical protein
MSNKEKEKPASKPTRLIPIYREERVDFVTYLRTPVNGKFRGTANRNERSRLSLALGYLGIKDIWKKTRRSEDGRTRASAIPPVEVIEITKDAIVYLLEVMTDMSYEEALNLMEFEQRLVDAQSEKWELEPEFQKIWDDQETLKNVDLSTVQDAEPASPSPDSPPVQ